MKRNKGLDLSGSYIEDVKDLEKKEFDTGPTTYRAPSRKSTEFRLVIFKLNEKAMDWLRPRDVTVFYDIESTKFLWPDPPN